MKKKIIIIVGLIILIPIFIFGGVKLYRYYQIKNAKIIVTLKEQRTIEFTEKRKVSDFITSINGKIIDDYQIDGTKLGKETIKFEFINDDGIKVPYEYDIEVVDTVAPLLWMNSSYTINVGKEFNYKDKIMCADNADPKPTCVVEGQYDTSKEGTYPLVYKATDKSGNTSTKNFNLYVKKPNTNNGGTSSGTTNPPVKTSFQDIITKHKNENTKIGIDVSSWQGDIDFESLKNAGVEFMMIRVGGNKGINKEYFVDSKFVQNITQANEYGIDVGIYFYSYSNTKELAIQDAKWVLEQIKDYKVTLPIAFDWENWSDYNDYELSFYGLTEMATAFIETIKNAGYEGMLYSSKAYLEKIWLPNDHIKWLAHYTEKTNYAGDYRFWQLCNDGQVAGIKGDVDINVMYLNQ